MNIPKLFAASCLALSLITPVFAQEPPKSKAERGAMEGPGMREEMQAEMKTMDERLDRLVIDMNAAATPDARLNAAIAVINEIVTQHKRMHERMGHRWMERHHGPTAPTKDEKK